MSAIAFTCGPTGGHIYPAIAVAQELSGYRPVFIGTPDRQDHAIVPRYGFDYQAISSAFRNPIKMTRAFWQSRRIFKQVKPEALVSTGGYHTLPVVLAARSKNIPVFLLEQNAIPGKANRVLAPFAQRIFLTFEASESYFPNKKALVVGNPVRKTFLPDPRVAALQLVSLSQSKWLLSIGGSQGAKALNEFLTAQVSQFCDANIGCLHLTGPRHYQTVISALEQSSPLGTQKKQLADGITLFSIGGKPIWIVMDYCEQMDALYQSVDWVLCRAGATTIAELDHFQKPAILVPYPYATDNHQAANAKTLEEKGQGIQIPQDQLNWNIMIEALDQLTTKAQPKDGPAISFLISEIITKTLQSPS